MHKKVKISASIFLALLICIFPFFTLSKSVAVKASNANKVHLVLNMIAYNNGIPKNFRKTSDLTVIKDKINLNLNGLDKLNISGSAQFSEYSLPLMINAIKTSLPITVVDLRQESHGFINGFAVSFANSKNNANAGLIREQVLLDEVNKLNNIKLNVPITFYNQPRKNITPVKVQNENELVLSKSLSYTRITVRDGGIPSDDMVDYFIELVRTQPKNSWLHFHCKHGIGRTGTFMIMYDMAKNYKNVNADDIIKRQLALGRYDKGELKSFYSDERISFLKTFYDYCKTNGDYFNIKWSEWNKTSAVSILNITPGYIKNPVVPKFLYVISGDSMTPSERTMVASLQGLVNSHCSFQIYMLNSSTPDYKIWLEDLKNNYKVYYITISDPWELFTIYKNYIDGYVLYSSKTPKDPSINNACTLASLNRAIVVDEAIEPKVRENGITKVNGDCRNTDESWAYNNLWNKGLNHSMVIELSPSQDAPLRDYAIMTKSLVFYENSVNKTVLRDKIFSSIKDSSICLGWGPDEFINVGTASKYGISVVAADWSYNLTTLSAFPSLPVTKKSPLSIYGDKNFHYVTFIMSDGDNLQWNLGTNYSSGKWFGAHSRDKLKLGWSMTPSLYYLAPTVFNLYYKDIKNEDVNNNFIVAPSGNGYMYPSKFNGNKLDTYISKLNNYMGKVDESYLTIIDDSAFNNIQLWDKFTQKSNIHGLFYLDYHRYNNFHGEILWSNNKPIVSCRDLLWDTLENEDELIRNINERATSGNTNACSPKSYTLVYVHVWSKDVSNVEKVINKLNQNPNVRIVTPEIFMELIKRNVKH